MKMFRMTLLSVAFTVGTCFASVVSAEESVAKESLYDRLGGLRGITVTVDDFMNRIEVNKELNKNPAIEASKISSPLPYLKFQVTQLVCQVTGGPCKYTGLPVKDAHAHLSISEKEWGEMAGEFKKSLDKYKVPEADQKELFDLVGSTKGDVVVMK